MPMVEVLVLCEAGADYETATQLARRVAEERGSLTGPLESVLRWRGIASETSFTALSSLKRESQAAGLRLPRYLGHVKGAPQKHDAALARRGVLIARQLQGSGPEIALLFVRDLDSRPDRLQGLEQARDEATDKGVKMILATPDPEREAWVLAGFVPGNPEEEERLKREVRRLGFDPCVEAHRLRGDVRRSAQEKRDIKKTLERLVGDDRNREKACWEVTPLDLLEERGRISRLAAYFQEIERRLLPLLS